MYVRVPYTYTHTQTQIDPRSKTLSIDKIRTLEGSPDVDLDTVGSTKVGAMMVEVIDPVDDYLKVRSGMYV